MSKKGSVEKVDPESYEIDIPDIEPTESEKALVDIAGEKWDRYKAKYKPLEKKYLGLAEQQRAAYGVEMGAADAAQTAAQSRGSSLAADRGAAVGAFSNWANQSGSGAAAGHSAARSADFTNRTSMKLDALAQANRLQGSMQQGLAGVASAGASAAAGTASAQMNSNLGLAQQRFRTDSDIAAMDYNRQNRRLGYLAEAGMGYAGWKMGQYKP
jgi:hypothetical protein